MFCFHMPTFLQGKYLHADTYLRPCCFAPPFRKAIFFGAPICVFDKFGCAAGKKGTEHYIRYTAKVEQTVNQVRV
jgi:hypothetical protein